MKLDMFSHFMPGRYFERLSSLPTYRVPSLGEVPGTLADLDARRRLMDEFPDYAQVLTLAQPAIEVVAQGDDAVDLATMANDELAEVVEGDRESFVGFAGALPMAYPDRAVAELERAVRDLGAFGAQIYTNVQGAALHDERFDAVFAKAVELDAVLWLHPTRGPDATDYVDEDRSHFGTFLSLGWPYETTVCVYRLALAGVFERHPGLKLVLHHGGGLIAHIAQRLGKGLRPPEKEVMAELLDDESDTIGQYIARHVYVDTALNGYLPAVECSLAFFDSSRVMFGSDMPYDDDDGRSYIRDTIANVEALDVSEAVRSDIFEGNAKRLLGLDA